MLKLKNKVKNPIKLLSIVIVLMAMVNTYSFTQSKHKLSIGISSEGYRYKPSKREMKPVILYHELSAIVGYGITDRIQLYGEFGRSFNNFGLKTTYFGGFFSRYMIKKYRSAHLYCGNGFFMSNVYYEDTPEGKKEIIGNKISGLQARVFSGVDVRIYKGLSFAFDYGLRYINGFGFGTSKDVRLHYTF